MYVLDDDACRERTERGDYEGFLSLCIRGFLQSGVVDGNGVVRREVGGWEVGGTEDTVMWNVNVHVHGLMINFPFVLRAVV